MHACPVLGERPEQGDDRSWSHKEDDIGVTADGLCRSIDKE